MKRPKSTALTVQEVYALGKEERLRRYDQYALLLELDKLPLEEKQHLVHSPRAWERHSVIKEETAAQVWEEVWQLTISVEATAASPEYAGLSLGQWEEMYGELLWEIASWYDDTLGLDDA